MLLVSYIENKHIYSYIKLIVPKEIFQMYNEVLSKVLSKIYMSRDMKKPTK